jgi:hypothetical protein
VFGHRRCFVSAAIAGLAVPAGASGDVEPIHFQYVASAPCPDEASFLALVRGRTQRWREAAVGAEDARQFLVEAGVSEVGCRTRHSSERCGPEHQTAGRLAWARLTVTESGKAGAPREIRAPSCDEAVGAIAVVAALAIDPTASTAPVAAPTHPTPPPPAVTEEKVVPAPVVGE